MPREKHTSDDVQRTSVYLEREDRAAIHWIKEARKGRGSKRTTANDILRDALWYFLEETEERTKEQMLALLPPKPAIENESRNKIAQMPKPKKKR